MFDWSDRFKVKMFGKEKNQTTDSDYLNFLLRFFKLSDSFEIGKDSFWWRTDGKYAPVTIFANCNDLFYWACADCEKITPENIGELEKALMDLKPFIDAGEESVKNFNNDAPFISGGLGVLLFCARIRKMRPQGAYYDVFPPGIRELFDAAGPDRSLEKGNTQYREYQPTNMVFPKNITEDPPWKCRSCIERENSQL